MTEPHCLYCGQTRYKHLETNGMYVCDLSSFRGELFKGLDLETLHTWQAPPSEPTPAAQIEAQRASCRKANINPQVWQKRLERQRMKDFRINLEKMLAGQRETRGGPSKPVDPLVLGWIYSGWRKDLTAKQIVDTVNNARPGTGLTTNRYYEIASYFRTS